MPTKRNGRLATDKTLITNMPAAKKENSSNILKKNITEKIKPNKN
jgi:hypothetical protein